MNKSIIILFLLFVGINAFSANYYCDPAIGNMTNNGSINSPWSTLEAVFNAGKTFVAGDIIFLKSGFHGSPTIKGMNSDYITIQPAEGALPTFKSVTFNSASKWIISGFKISPQLATPVIYNYQTKLVSIPASCSFITVQNCEIYTMTDISSASQTDWETKMAIGVSCGAPNCLITKNKIYNISMGIEIQYTGVASVASYNTIENIGDDATRGLANYCKFEYNTVQNMYVANANHDDLFQAWTGGIPGHTEIGSDTITGIEIRGNKFISCTDPNQPLQTATQGIGCFDGFAKGWIIENNLVCETSWHGISLYGAINCKIVNNTVVVNPNQATSTMKPAINVIAHKNGTYSTNNLIRNNLAVTINTNTNAGVIDHNILITDYSKHFVNYSQLDLHLIASSTAVKGGLNTSAPLLDLDQKVRTLPFDVGCYMYSQNTGLSESKIDNSSLFYPNPAQNYLNIDVSQDFDWVSFYDGSGRKIKTVQCTKTIDISSLKNGLYLVELSGSNKYVKSLLIKN